MDQADSRRSTVIPAPYGQACTNCSRAKYRCIYRSGRRECERCHRLQKECVPSVSARRLSGRHLMGCRAVDLEEKIDNLMTILQNQAAEKANCSHNSQPPAGISTPASSDHNREGNDSNSFGTHTHPSSPELIAGPAGHSADPLVTGESAYRQRSQFDIIPSAFEPQPQQAEDCLAYFRLRMLTFFPFMYLPPHVTALQLREWYPFLWANIMAVTAKHVIGQELPITDSIKRFVAQKIVVENELNLDLLLGLLVFICWFHFHHLGKTYITVMISLAYSVITEMKLNKVLLETQATVPCSRTPCQDTKTTAESRAVLAYFYLSSQLSYAKKGIDIPEWTPFLDGCLQTVSQYPEWPGDEQLAAQIKMQLLVNQIGQGSWKNQELQPSVSFLEGLQSQLEKIKTQLPRSLTQNDKHAFSITNHLLYSEVAIQDAILTKPPVSLYSPNYQRQQLLETHLTTIARTFDHFFATPKDHYSAMAFIRWCQITHCLRLLHRMYVLDEPSWDCAAARERVDLFALGDRLVSVLVETGTSRTSRGDDASPRDGSSDDNMYITFSRRIRSMCSAWSAELQSSERRQQQQSQSQGLWSAPNVDVDAGIQGVVASGGMAQAFEMISDDAWMNEIFNMS